MSKKYKQYTILYTIFSLKMFEFEKKVISVKIILNFYLISPNSKKVENNKF